MKIETNPVPRNTAQEAVNSNSIAQSARERAINKLLGNNTPNQAQQAPVQNPTSVSPEEMGALRTQPKGQSDGQPDVIVQEAPPVETKAPEEPISSQYAILARKEKAIRQREQQLRAREAAIKASETPATPKAPETDMSKFVSKDRLTQDPFSVLTELGLSYEQLTEFAMNAPKPETLAVLNEIKALKAELEEVRGSTKKSFEEREQAQIDQALKLYKNEVVSLVKEFPDEYETIHATKSYDDVVSLIKRTLDEDGIVLSVERAAQLVEAELNEEAFNLTKLKKIQQRLQPKAAPVVEKPTDTGQSQIKTLTNSVSSSRQLSARERALLAFQGKLNK